jgi:phosphoribosyl 1,2-cyclic phosphodiesterase
MSLRIRFWGTRGSIPSPGPRTVRYGGNTPCVEVRTAEGCLVILDAGTGIRELGRSLIARADGKPIEGDIFLTHAHWDHIQGLPFFAPIFQRGNQFTIWGSRSQVPAIDRAIRDQMSPSVFPVSFAELDATIAFREIGDLPLSGRGYELSALPVRHPGGALGYRLLDGNGTGGALVYISDNELGPSSQYDSPNGWREELVQFARGASVLVHDSMYTVEEYDHHRGWGHSTYRDVVDLALEAGVGRLVLFHHKPERTDDEVDQRVEECRVAVKERGRKLEIVAAAEGMSLTV